MHFLISILDIFLMYPFFFSLLPILYPQTLPGKAPVSLDGTQREDTPPCLMVTWMLLSCFLTERGLHGSKKDVGGKLSVRVAHLVRFLHGQRRGGGCPGPRGLWATEGGSRMVQGEAFLRAGWVGDV